MADITVTAANVVPSTGAVTERGTAGETIAAGKFVEKDPTTKKYMLADSNSGTKSVQRGRGIALNSASLDQALVVQTAGNINLGATLVKGTTYALSETPGGIQPTTDLASGEFVTILGTAISASILKMAINVTDASV